MVISMIMHPASKINCIFLARVNNFVYFSCKNSPIFCILHIYTMHARYDQDLGWFCWKLFVGYAR